MYSNYPKHFCEHIRIEIAVSQIQHDLRKLLPSISENGWLKIDQDIAEWPSGEKFEIDSIHDFWNFFGGFSRGLKMKSLLNWITAQNVEWTKKDIRTSEAIITWDFVGLEFMGKSPYLGKDITKKLSDPNYKSIKETLIKDSDFRSQRYAPRDQFPIIVVEDFEGNIFNPLKGYYCLEGNRRVIKALLKNEETISSYVGKFKSGAARWPENYWFRSDILKDLVFLAHYYNLKDQKKSFEITKLFYQIVLRDFENTRSATVERIFKFIERDEKFLVELLTEEYHEDRGNEPSAR